MAIYTFHHAAKSDDSSLYDIFVDCGFSQQQERLMVYTS